MNEKETKPSVLCQSRSVKPSALKSVRYLKFQGKSGVGKLDFFAVFDVALIWDAGGGCWIWDCGSALARSPAAMSPSAARISRPAVDLKYFEIVMFLNRKWAIKTNHAHAAE